jgi:hypothetical protein
MPIIDDIGIKAIEEALKYVSSSPTSKVWIWMDFVKPGRNVFCIKTPAGFEPIKQKPTYYMHKFLGT